MNLYFKWTSNPLVEKSWTHAKNKNETRKAFKTASFNGNDAISFAKGGNQRENCRAMHNLDSQRDNKGELKADYSSFSP